MMFSCLNLTSLMYAIISLNTKHINFEIHGFYLSLYVSLILNKYNNLILNVKIYMCEYICNIHIKLTMREYF
jgi:hypothetical protein